ncbi:MAG: hypothetical protein KatS3mg108_1629 [Isosphaeraceae bacterium]|jgi:hypothetical protein|nr:MAG: hypothetical protein KatS3mg108_1629 [Isosphaeraceae bacterium]
MILTAAVVTLLGSQHAAAGATPREPAYPDRWVYVMTNLQVDAQADRLIELMNEAQAAGYTGVVLADYKLNILDRVIERYRINAGRVRREADRLGLEIIPCVFPIGYSSGLLAHDPNLAEGLPAEALFEAKGDRLIHRPDPATAFRNGGLEEVENDRFRGFGFQDDPGAATVADREVVHGGRVSCRMRDSHITSTSGNSRLIQQVAVQPGRCYRFRAWIKTENLARPDGFRLAAITTDGRPLTFYEGGPQPTADWHPVQVVFNSLDANEVLLYVGLWGGSPGTLWIDDIALEEVALLNVLRRDGCPLSITTADGADSFQESIDVEPVIDPDLGVIPYAGEFDESHDPPHVRLRPGSRIREGQTIRIRWYHPILIHGNQVACCLSEPRVYELLEDQAQRVRDLFHPRRYFMSHDELRVANWCRACTARHLTPGQLLADNARRCVEILHRVDPGAEVLVWSDMFDPHHNAVARYYLVNGSLTGSWEGLPSRVVIVNWNGQNKTPSLRFFAERGHRQVIAGYYDCGDLSGFREWDTAARGIPGIRGFMYTTWRSDYQWLDEYGAALIGSAGQQP